MPKLMFFLCSKSSSIDRRSNALSLFEIAEELYVPAVPYQLDQLDIIALWERCEGDEDKEFQQRVTFEFEGDEQPQSLEQDFQLERTRHRSLSRILGFPVHREGCLKMRICVRESGGEEWGVPLAEWNVQVKKI